MSNHSEIADAIRERKVITFSYDGHPRTAIPTAIGPHVSTRNDVFRGYQIAGTSKTRAVPLWDLFLVDRVLDLRVTSEQVPTDPPGYQPNDKHISPVEAQL
jgi:hypothetical protein